MVTTYMFYDEGEGEGESEDESDGRADVILISLRHKINTLD